MKIGTGGNQILILHYLNLHDDKIFVMLLSPHGDHDGRCIIFYVKHLAKGAVMHIVGWTESNMLNVNIGEKSKGSTRS